MPQTTDTSRMASGSRRSWPTKRHQTGVLTPTTLQEPPEPLRQSYQLLRQLRAELQQQNEALLKSTYSKIHTQDDQTPATNLLGGLDEEDDTIDDASYSSVSTDSTSATPRSQSPLSITESTSLPTSTALTSSPATQSHEVSEPMKRNRDSLSETDEIDDESDVTESDQEDVEDESQPQPNPSTPFRVPASPQQVVDVLSPAIVATMQSKFDALFNSLQAYGRMKIDQAANGLEHELHLSRAQSREPSPARQKVPTYQLSARGRSRTERSAPATVSPAPTKRFQSPQSARSPPRKSRYSTPQPTVHPPPFIPRSTTQQYTHAPNPTVCAFGSHFHQRSQSALERRQAVMSHPNILLPQTNQVGPKRHESFNDKEHKQSPIYKRPHSATIPIIDLSHPSPSPTVNTPSNIILSSPVQRVSSRRPARSIPASSARNEFYLRSQQKAREKQERLEALKRRVELDELEKIDSTRPTKSTSRSNSKTRGVAVKPVIRTNSNKKQSPPKVLAFGSNPHKPLESSPAVPIRSQPIRQPNFSTPTKTVRHSSIHSPISLISPPPQTPLSPHHMRQVDPAAWLKRLDAMEREVNEIAQWYLAEREREMTVAVNAPATPSQRTRSTPRHISTSSMSLNSIESSELKSIIATESTGNAVAPSVITDVDQRFQQRVKLLDEKKEWIMAERRLIQAKEKLQQESTTNRPDRQRITTPPSATLTSTSQPATIQSDEPLATPIESESQFLPVDETNGDVLDRSVSSDRAAAEVTDDSHVTAVNVTMDSTTNEVNHSLSAPSTNLPVTTPFVNEYDSNVNSPSTQPNSFSASITHPPPSPNDLPEPEEWTASSLQFGNKKADTQSSLISLAKTSLALNVDAPVVADLPPIHQNQPSLSVSYSLIRGNNTAINYTFSGRGQPFPTLDETHQQPINLDDSEVHTTSADVSSQNSPKIPSEPDQPSHTKNTQLEPIPSVTPASDSFEPEEWTASNLQFNSTSTTNSMPRSSSSTSPSAFELITPTDASIKDQSSGSNLHTKRTSRDLSVIDVEPPTTHRATSLEINQMISTVPQITDGNSTTKPPQSSPSPPTHNRLPSWCDPNVELFSPPLAASPRPQLESSASVYDATSLVETSPEPLHPTGHKKHPSSARRRSSTAHPSPINHRLSSSSTGSRHFGGSGALSLPTPGRKLTAHSMDSDDEAIRLARKAAVDSLVPSVGATDDEQTFNIPNEEELFKSSLYKTDLHQSHFDTSNLSPNKPTPAASNDMSENTDDDPHQSHSRVRTPSSRPRTSSDVRRPSSLLVSEDATTSAAEDLLTARALRREKLRRRSHRVSVTGSTISAASSQPTSHTMSLTPPSTEGEISELEEDDASPRRSHANNTTSPAAATTISHPQLEQPRPNSAASIFLPSSFPSSSLPPVHPTITPTATPPVSVRSPTIGTVNMYSMLARESRSKRDARSSASSTAASSASSRNPSPVKSPAITLSIDQPDQHGLFTLNELGVIPPTNSNNGR